MSIVLDGTTGITTPSLTNTGTETLVNLTTTGNTTLGDATTDTLTVGVTGIVKDASGNVGIGTASPSTYGKLVSLGTDNATLFAAVGATNMLRVQGYNSTYVGTVLEAVNLAQSANTPLFINGSTLKFGISGTTQTTIDSSGNLLVGGTTAYGITTIYRANDSGRALALRNNAASAGKNFGFVVDSNNTMYVQGTSNGVYLADTGTAWVTNSDERLKTVLTPFENAAEKVCSLRAGTGRYLTDEESVSRSFLIAQDVQKVLPEAVNVQDDEMGTLGLAYTDVIPLLVSAIKEQQALITQLTNRISALEQK